MKKKYLTERKWALDLKEDNNWLTKKIQEIKKENRWIKDQITYNRITDKRKRDRSSHKDYSQIDPVNTSMKSEKSSMCKITRLRSASPKKNLLSPNKEQNKSRKRLGKSPNVSTIQNNWTGSYLNSSQMSQEHSHLHHEHGGSSRYCETCKWKKWRKDQLNYDPEMLLQCRDMIKQVICIGCEHKFDMRIFLEHAGDCRWSNNISHINLNTVYTGKSRKKSKAKQSSYF